MKNLTGYSIHTLELGPMENFIYLLHDHASNTAAVVDPAWEVDDILQLAKQKNITITDILLTHSHHDHTNGLEQMLNQTDARVHLLKAEKKFWGAQLSKPVLHDGGDRLKLGETEIQFLHTPGHTPGSACFYLGDDLIAGDTLFVFGCGRCDLAGGDPEQMFHSLNKIKTELPAATVLHPGHNYAPQAPTSSLHKQCESNPFLHFDRVEDFTKYRMRIHDKIRDIPYGEVSKAEALNALKNA